MPLILRVRGPAGTWRITVPSADASVADVKAALEAEKQVPSARATLSADQNHSQELDDGASLAAQGLGANGSPTRVWKV